MTEALGIHLGLINSICAYIRRIEPRVIDNLDNEPLTPSVVHLTEYGEWVVGKTAKKSAAVSNEDAENTVFSIQRFMGRDFNDNVCAEDIKNSPLEVQKAPNGEVEVILRGRRFSPPEISAFILEALKKGAEDYLDKEVEHAVITVPVYFGIRQINATRMAGRLAGLNVLKLISEPSAAAIAYGFLPYERKLKTILVYDQGEDGLNATVMQIGKGVLEDLGKSGDMYLGGDSFDYKILDWLFEQARIQHGVDFRNIANYYVRYHLRQAAEEAKLALSRSTRALIRIPALTKLDGKIRTLECELKRDDFNGMIKSLVDRSVDLVYEAIKLARTTPDEIDAILLVGGSTRVPLVKDTLCDIFGEKVIQRDISPIYCVAQGAAIQTSFIEDIVVEKDESIIQCEHCGTLNLNSRVECRNCGKKLKDGGFYQVKHHVQLMVICSDCGRENPQGTINCNYCGASVQGKDDTLLFFRTTPHPIGIRMVDGKMDIIIPEATIYPTKQPKGIVKKTTYHGQSTICFPLYEGCDQIAVKNHFLGYAVCKLVTGLPKDTDVEILFWIDLDGILQITAQLPDQPWVHITAFIQWS